MALPPHFRGIENEAHNCNINHQGLQITPIKILLQLCMKSPEFFEPWWFWQISSEFLHVKLLMGFGSRETSRSWRRWTAWRIQGLEARRGLLRLKSSLDSSQSPLQKEEKCQGVSPLCVFLFSTLSLVFLRMYFYPCAPSCIIEDLKSWPKLAPKCFRHSIWSAVRDSLAPSSNCGLAVVSHAPSCEC